MGEEAPKTRNPLLLLLDLLKAVSGVLGLASLVDNWFNDALKWKQFAQALIDFYRSVVDPVFGFLLGWLPLEIPRYVHDLLVIALLIGASFASGLRLVESFSDELRHNRARVVLVPLFAVASSLLIGVTFPIFLAMHLLRKNPPPPNISEEGKLGLRWLAANVLGFVVLLALGARWNAS
jgi:hypothetical protein